MRAIVLLKGNIIFCKLEKSFKIKNNDEKSKIGISHRYFCEWG